MAVASRKDRRLIRKPHGKRREASAPPRRERPAEGHNRFAEKDQRRQARTKSRSPRKARKARKARKEDKRPRQKKTTQGGGIAEPLPDRSFLLASFRAFRGESLFVLFVVQPFLARGTSARCIRSIASRAWFSMMTKGGAMRRTFWASGPMRWMPSPFVPSPS